MAAIFSSIPQIQACKQLLCQCLQQLRSSRLSQILIGLKTSNNTSLDEKPAALSQDVGKQVFWEVGCHLGVVDLKDETLC